MQAPEVILSKEQMPVMDYFTIERIKELEREKDILTLKIEQLEKQRCKKDACPYLDNEPVLKVKAERNYLRKEVDKLMNLMDFATQKIRSLDAECNRLKKQLYGSKTERRKIEESKSIPYSVDKRETKKERGAQHGHQGYGRKIPINLPVVEEFHELPAEERCCQRCGLPLTELPTTEDSYEIGVRTTYFLRRNRRRKYKKTCSCPNPIITAHPTPKVIPKGKFDISFWIKVILDKYLFQLPLQRQVFQMKLLGLDVSKGTIIKGLKKLYEHLLPLYNLFREEVKAANHWHADETGWFVFIETEDKKDFKWWLWVVVTKEIVFYIIDESRSGEIIKELLSENSSGIANVDRYSGYKRLGIKIQLAYCWVHVRRDFIQLQTKYPEDSLLVDWTQVWIDNIAQLYIINNKRLEYIDNPLQFSVYQKQLIEKLEDMRKSSLMDYNHPEQIRVMESLKNHWKGLTVFLDHPEIPMDNNLAERCFKNPVLGRKNYYGNHSEIGWKMVALFFTMNQTYLFNQLDPGACLEYYFKECAKNNGPPEDLRKFLPHILKENGPSTLKLPP